MTISSKLGENWHLYWTLKYTEQERAEQEEKEIQKQRQQQQLTSWSGQLQELDGQEAITTFWLLTIETKPDANWKSTLIGQDIFRHTRPTDESISQALRLRNSSHPL
jgi:avidin family protein